MHLLATLVRAARHQLAGTARGQSLAELVIILPALLLITLIAIDFGRAYLGYINLQQMARSGAAFAADNASAWDPPGKPAIQDRYQRQIINDARFINCELPTDAGGNVVVPDPMFPTGFSLGDSAQVQLACNFTVITPVISQILGGQILVGGSAVFPIREAAVGSVPGGGSGGVPAPVADFIGAPRSGWAPLEVDFTDLSTNGPTSWIWTFEGQGASFLENPTQIFDCAGPEGTVCVYDVSLQASNSGGFDLETKTDYITVTVPPASGPIADFVADPTNGQEPLTVDFDFVDLRGGAVTYTAYDWDFDDADGITYADATGPAVSNTYATSGVYSISLRVTDSGGLTNEITKAAYVVVADKICIVPDFAGRPKNPQNANLDLWADQGFTGSITYRPPNNNYTIQSQSIVGGTVDPQPLGCGSNIILGP